MVAFRGQKNLEPRPDWSPFNSCNSKFPTSIPTPFICGASPGVSSLNPALVSTRSSYYFI